MLESLYGFVLAFALGVPLAVAIAGSRTLNLMFYPLLIATQSLPKVALAPLILVWLGIGMESKLAIAWLVAFFPIVVDTATGLRNTPGGIPRPRHVGAREPHCRRSGRCDFRRRCRSSFRGSKVAITLAVIGAVIGEFIGSNEGLGNLLLVANSQINIPLAFACLIGLAVIGIGLYAAVAAVELGAEALVRRARRTASPGAPAFVQYPLHLYAAAVVVAHQVVDRPAHVLVAALLARLELVGDVGAVALALPHEARAERALLALVFGKARFDAKRGDGIGKVLGVHRAFCGSGARDAAAPGRPRRPAAPRGRTRSAAR